MLTQVLTRDFPLDDAVEVFIRPRTPCASSKEVRSEDPGLTRYLRIEERELEKFSELQLPRPRSRSRSLVARGEP